VQRGHSSRRGQGVAAIVATPNEKTRASSSFSNWEAWSLHGFDRPVALPRDCLRLVTVVADRDELCIGAP